MTFFHAHDLAAQPDRSANLWRVTNDRTYLLSYRLSNPMICIVGLVRILTMCPIHAVQNIGAFVCFV